MNTYVVRSLAEGGGDLRASVCGTDRKGFVVVLAGKGLANVSNPCNNILFGRIVVCGVVVELRGYEHPTTCVQITLQAHLAQNILVAHLRACQSEDQDRRSNIRTVMPRMLSTPYLSKASNKAVCWRWKTSSVPSL